MRSSVVAIILSLSVSIPAHARRSNVQPIVVPDTGNNRVLIYNAPSTSGQAADVVLGQSTFDSTISGASSTSMSSPTYFALDGAGNLFVSDTGNCRVLVFKPPFTTGKAASFVIGKPDFTSSCGIPTFPGPFAEPAINDSSASQTNLGKTGGVAIDKRGGLWIADTGNNRVLHFPSPLKTPIADIVIGQPDFTSSACPEPSANSLCAPVGVAVDAGGILWVVDRNDNRVLAYSSPRTFAAANFVINGFDPVLTSAIPSSSWRPISLPTGIATGPNGALWIADTGNNRVLKFTVTPLTILTTQFGLDLFPSVSPQVVLGQNDLWTPYPNQDSSPGPNTLSSPQGVIVAKDGSVWVGDTFNNRTLRFAPPFGTGMNANLVLGQPDFFQTFPNQDGTPSAQTQNQPFDSIVAVEAGSSALAIAVLLALSGVWLLSRRIRRGVA